MPGLFITATDTGAGKTFVSSWLLYQLQHAGKRVAGMKPIASGAEVRHGERWNEDVAQLKRATNIELPDEWINPYLFDLPASPHIAAAKENRVIDLALIQQRYLQIATKADWVVVEGVGGWLAPISNTETVASMAKELALPVVLVVGIRLGCLNHAMLTASRIINDGFKLQGWIANILEPQMHGLDENIHYLQTNINAPCLGVLPYTKVQSINELDISLNTDLLI